MTDEEIRQTAAQVMRLYRKGRHVHTAIANGLADRMELAGVTEADLERLGIVEADLPVSEDKP